MPRPQASTPPRAEPTPPPLAAMRGQVTGAELETNRRRIKLAYLLSTVMTPAFGWTDILWEWTRPEEIALTWALLTRVLTALVTGAGFVRLSAAAPITAREVDRWVDFLPPFMAVMVAWIHVCADGIASPYHGAICLPIGAYAFVPRRYTKMLVSGVLTTLSLPTVLLLAPLLWDRAQHQAAQPRFAFDLLVTTSIIGGMVIILISASHMLWALRKEVFEARSIGRYRVRRKLGEGGMGEVWAAYDSNLRREVALKVLRLDQQEGTRLQRFEREVHATTKLTHPNTVRVMDYGVTDDGLSYYAMELLEGQPLSSLLSSEGRLPPARALHFGLCAARALAEAHARGIVHRDIKPENLFITTAGDEPDFLKVLDFGVARLLDVDAGTQLTRTGAMAGTPRYIAPEVLAGKPSGTAADVYALGVVLYQMLSGHLPYAADEEDSINFLASLTMEPVALSTHVRVPPSLEAVVMRCLARHPDQRYPDARALVDALSGCELDGADYLAPAPGRTTPLPTPASAPTVETPPTPGTVWPRA